MPTHQLADSTVRDAVIAVLTGGPVIDVAHDHGIDPQALTDAATVYDHAGHDALKQHLTTDWVQLYLHYTDWTNTDTTFVTHVLPILEKAAADGAIDGWWYTRKHPCWRLRLHLSQRGAEPVIEDAFNQLVTNRHLNRWWRGIYEPESAAFGGETAMAAAHHLFVTDSREIQQLRHRNDLSLRPRELSILLSTIMLRAAKLEWYEQGDVWHRVITDEHRDTLGNTPTGRIDSLSQQISPLLLADTNVLTRPTGPLAQVNTWATAFHTAGKTLADAVQQGTLQRGIRQVLAYHIIFHWNRLGLSLQGQSALAAAAKTAILHNESADR